MSAVFIIILCTNVTDPESTGWSYQPCILEVGASVIQHTLSDLQGGLLYTEQ